MKIRYCKDEIEDIFDGKKITMIYRIGLLDIDKQDNNKEIINNFFENTEYQNFLYVLTSGDKIPNIKEKYKNYIVAYSTKGFIVKNRNNILEELLKQRKYTDITKEVLRIEKLNRINGKNN